VAALKSELEYNRNLVLDAVKSCEKNKTLREQNKKNEQTMVSAYLMSSATEALNINRYLDLEDKFYEATSIYLSCVLTFNRYLENWFYDLEYYEGRILERKSNILPALEAVEKYLQTLDNK
jgi:putative IMPACT (imprinted ancient) family translation regulator